jgi:hypothetical protein
MAQTIQINRAPVLTLWAAVVAERLGIDRGQALTLGKALAGLNAQSKARRLHLYGMPETAVKKKSTIRRADTTHVRRLMGREIPVSIHGDSVRATSKGQPEDPDAVERYLASKFGKALSDARTAMEALARGYTAAELDDTGFALYEDFRPAIPEGKKGWGAKGTLDLDYIRRLAAKRNA